MLLTRRGCGELCGISAVFEDILRSGNGLYRPCIYFAAAHPHRMAGETGAILVGWAVWFFFPSGDVGCTPPKDVTKGFDILLDCESTDGLAAKLYGPWTTLAFSEDICTENEMLESLMAIKAEGMSEAAKRSLYSAICVLAGHLMREVVVAQYEVVFRKMLSLE